MRKSSGGMVGNGMGVKTCECTFIGWNGTATELVIGLLVEGFQLNQCHSLVDDKLIKVGLSFKPHKKFVNVFQILYVK